MDPNSVVKVKSVVNDIAVENGMKKFKVTFKEDKFTGENYSSQIMRAEINEDGGENRVIKLFIKISCLKDVAGDRWSVEDIFAREINAYNVVFPELHQFQIEHNIPEDGQFKYIKFFKGGDDYVIMEDISQFGFSLYGKDKNIDFEHAVVVLQNLANFHAMSFAMKQKEPERFTKIKSSILDQFGFPEFIFDMAVNSPNQIIPHVKCEKKRNAIKAVIEKRYSITKCVDPTLTEPYNTICHGDLWNNNMLFRKQGGSTECLFLDYQLIRYASPAVDIMYNFFLSTDGAFREKYFDQLCDIYHKALESNLKQYGLDVNQVYPKDVFLKHIEHTAPLGALFGIIACSMLLRKSGEEQKLNDWINDASKLSYTLNDNMIHRMEGLADDIIKYRCVENM